MKLRSHLVTLVVVSLLPALIFSAVLVVMFSTQQRTAQEKTVIDVAQAISHSVDRELSSWIRALEALATSEHLDSGNLREFYQQAQRVLKADTSWDNLLLADLSGQLLNLRLPFGSPRVPVGNPELVKDVYTNGKPFISDLFTGRLTNRPMLVVAVPVVRDGQVRYVLTSSAGPRFLQEILSQQKISADWVITVLDRNKKIIAKSRKHEEFLGKPTAPTLAPASPQAKAGSYEGVTGQGLRMSTGFRRSDLSGWTVAVGIPVPVLEAPIRRSLLNIAVGGILLLTLGITLAMIYGRRIAGPITALADTAAALGRNEEVTPVNSCIEEVDQVAQVLQAAAASRAQAEQSLRDSEERLRLAVQGGNIGTWHWNRITGEHIWSEKCREIFGIDADAPVDRKVFLNAIFPEERDHVLQAVTQALEQKKYFDVEYHIRRPDGTIRWLSAKGRGYYDAQGTLIRNEGVILDITEKKQAEEKVLAVEKRFRALIENSADGIALFSHDEEIQYLSPTASRILGYTANELTGLSFSQFIHPDDSSRFQDTFADIRRTPFATWPVQFRYRHKNGSWRWMDAVLTNLLEEPNVQAIVGNYRDVTDRKRTEQALQGRYQELQWLHEVSQAILASKDLRATVATILDKAISVSQCDLGIIRLLNRKTGLLETIASHGYVDPENLLRHQSSTRDQSRYRAIPMFVDNEPIVIDNVQEVEGVRTFKREGLRALIIVPLSADQEILGLLQVGSRTERTFEPNVLTLLKTLGSNLGIAVQKSRLLEDMVASQNELRGLARKLVEAQETERRYIARELHDEIGQILTGLKFFLDFAMPPQTNGPNSKFEDALTLVDQLMARVRDLSLRFRPGMLDDLGLLPTLQWYFQNFTDQTNIHFEFDHAGLDRRFAPEFETAAYRIVQESVTNAARHANVNEIKVRCWANEEKVCIEIEDHGTGFDPNTILPVTAGLSGMRERAASLGGQLTVRSAPGLGTRITAEFPLASVQQTTHL